MYVVNHIPVPAIFLCEELLDIWVRVDEDMPIGTAIHFKCFCIVFIQLILLGKRPMPVLVVVAARPRSDTD